MIRTLTIGLLAGCFSKPPPPESMDASTGTNTAFRLGGIAGTSITLDNRDQLHLQAFTIEAWIQITGPGVPSASGNASSSSDAGFDPILPLVTRGRADDDNDPTIDVNYFVGIVPAPSGGMVFAADFESEPGGSNHPIPSPTLIGAGGSGLTLIDDGAWHHVAAALDGQQWILYVDGVVTATAAGALADDLALAKPAIGGAYRSTESTPDGAFDGWIDEVRIWSRARTYAEIEQAQHQRISMHTDLVARWGFDEGEGAVLHDSAGSAIASTIAGGVEWGPGAPLQ